MRVAYVEIVVAVHARAHDCRRTHHRHSATHHSHLEIGPGHILAQERLRLWIDQLLRYDVFPELIANNLRVAWANGFRRIEIRIGMRTERVVDGGAAHVEIAIDLILGGHRGDHCLRSRMSQPFVVEKEETLIANDRPTQRAAEVVANEM